MLFELNISIPSPSYGLRLRSVGAHTSDRLEALPNVKRRIDMIDVPSEDSSVVEIQHGVGARDLVDLTSLDYGKDQAKSYRTPPITLRKPEATALRRRSPKNSTIFYGSPIGS